MPNFDISKGIKLYNEENFADALAFFLTVEATTSEDASELAYYTGLTAIKLKKYETAVDSLEQVVIGSQDEKKIQQCRLLLSLAYAKTGRLQLAEAELKFLNTDEEQETSELLNALAFLAYEKGEAETAIAYYEKVLEKEAQNLTAMNGLGYILADCNRDIPRALMLCKQAVDAKPSYAPYLDSLAWVYHKMKLNNEAQSLIQKVQKMLPENKTVQSHYDAIFNV